MSVRVIFVATSGDALFSRRLEVIPKVGDIVNKGVRPIDYRVVEVRHNIGKASDGSEHEVQIIVRSDKKS
jgi:hypothetical protein